MSDITQAFDSYLIGKVKAKRWEDEFLSKWYKPLLKMITNAELEAIQNNVLSVQPNGNSDRKIRGG